MNFAISRSTLVFLFGVPKARRSPICLSENCTSIVVAANFQGLSSADVSNHSEEPIVAVSVASSSVGVSGVSELHTCACNVENETQGVHQRLDEALVQRVVLQ